MHVWFGRLFTAKLSYWSFFDMAPKGFLSPPGIKPIIFHLEEICANYCTKNMDITITSKAHSVILVRRLVPSQTPHPVTKPQILTLSKEWSVWICKIFVGKPRSKTVSKHRREERNVVCFKRLLVSKQHYARPYRKSPLERRVDTQNSFIQTVSPHLKSLMV